MSTASTEPLWAESVARIPYDAPVGVSGTVDLAVVGGGIMGLSAALHAARSGLKVHVLEANRIGEGASGLNGGQVIPGLKYDPDWIIDNFGVARGARLIAFAESTADQLFDLIATEKLDVPHRRNGWIQACHTVTALAAAASRHRQWAARGANVALLDGPEIGRMIGTDNYLGGFYDHRAGVIQPLAYTLELARIAALAGVGISENSKVASLRKHGQEWLVTTASGRQIRARHVIAATNAYTDDLIPGLARTLVPLHSFQIATAPMPVHVAGSILPGEQAVSDSRRILVYYRKTADGRLMLGGRGPMSQPKSAVDWSHLERALRRLFPALGNLPIEKRWFGKVAMTPDHLPHIHEPEKGLVTAVGCQGRGLGLMTAMGKRLADYLLSGDPEALPLPLTPIRPIPFHAFRQIGVAATITWYRMLDSVER